MTYVAEFFHKFSSEGTFMTVMALTSRQGRDGIQAGREVCRAHARSMVCSRYQYSAHVRSNKNDFERRMETLLSSMEDVKRGWQVNTPPTTYPEGIAHLAAFAEYKKTTKRAWVRERQELAALYSNIQTKLRTYALRAWEPRNGLRLEDLERQWKVLLVDEGTRSRAINARIRE
jgi:head-tail adaptor